MNDPQGKFEILRKISKKPQVSQRELAEELGFSLGKLNYCIKELQSKPIREMIAKMVGNENNFEGSYVRLEVLNDTQGFWLKPHCDIPEKLISSLIYINDTAEDISLGTDLYNEQLELKHTVPFWHNFGYIFHGPNKWHGMEKGKTIRTERRGIQINYVTFETDWKVE